MLCDSAGHPHHHAAQSSLGGREREGVRKTTSLCCRAVPLLRDGSHQAASAWACSYGFCSAATEPACPVSHRLQRL